VRERRRRRRGDESGVTLVELLVSMSLLGIVLPIFLGVLVSAQSGLVKQADRSQTNDQVRQAVEEIDREVRSGNVLFNPANENPPYMSLRVYTQANAPSRETGGLPGERCVQWRISGGQLQRRDWPLNTTTASSWRIIADHVVNTSSTPAFTLADPTTKRVLNIAIVVNQSSKHGSNVEVDDSVEGRNTVYSYPASLTCTPIPA